MVDATQTQSTIRQAGASLLNRTQSRATGSDALGKDDFLKLMMTQLTHQDPLNPLDSEGMVQQLTQMGALEQLTNINSNLEGLGRGQSDLMRANAYGLLDSDVTVQGASALVQQGRSPGLSFDLGREAAEVEVRITDASGKPLRTMKLGQTAAGPQRVPWDGLDNDGDPVLDGAYRYDVLARTSEGDTVPVALLTRGKVSGVRFQGGRPILSLSGQEVELRDVTAVSRESQRLFGNRQPYPLQEDMQPRPPAGQAPR